MTSPPKQILLQLVVIAAVFLIGCSEDDTGVNPSDRLCGGAAGLAADVTGTPKPVELCVSNDNTITFYTSPGGDVPAGRYETTSVFTTDSLTIEVSTMFYQQGATSQPLNVTGNLAQAESDPAGFWFQYTETKEGAYVFTSTTVTGSATLTFNDPTVAVVTFRNLEITLEDAATQADAGTRRISDGYLNVTVD